MSRSDIGPVGTAHVCDDSGQGAFARRDTPAKTDPTSWMVPFDDADTLELTVGAELVQNSSSVASTAASVPADVAAARAEAAATNYVPQEATDTLSHVDVKGVCRTP